MTKSQYLKAARAAAQGVAAQIEWLEGQDYGDHDQAWLQALEVLEAEHSAMWDQIEACKAKADALEQEGGRVRDAYWSAEGNAFDTARDNGWDMEQIENQVRVWKMATCEYTISDWLANNPA
jgi:hypothetical protein